MIADMFVGNMLSISLVESEEFHALLAYLEPEYKPPCRKSMMTRIDTLEAKCCTEMQEELEMMTAVTITTNIWTSIANNPYISLTAS